MIHQLSDRTLAEQLARRLRGARAFQIFIRQLGPDQVHASAWALTPDGEPVEARTVPAENLEAAITGMLLAIDRAAAPAPKRARTKRSGA